MIINKKLDSKLYKSLLVAFGTCGNAVGASPSVAWQKTALYWVASFSSFRDVIYIIPLKHCLKRKMCPKLMNKQIMVKGACCDLYGS